MSEFRLPPRLRNENGEKRKVGFEIEYSGVPLTTTVDLVIRLFDGEVRQENEYKYVVGTSLGAFTVEADSSFLQNTDPPEIVKSLAELVVPFEVATPPLAIDNLNPVERLREELRLHAAKGTNASVLSAFGMQFNPEVPDKSAPTLLAFLRSFFLLYDWLFEEGEIPMARRLAPFIHEFPETYISRVLDPSYAPDVRRLITDYLDHNSTRNRPLDLLPLFSDIDRELVFSYPVERELIKSRPTFHYRLPNSDVDDPDWSVAQDWNKWVIVEMLANRPDRIREMAVDYLQTKQTALIFSGARWANRTREWLASRD